MEKLIDNKEGNWTEDFVHENGNYMCSCCYCFKNFLGHKRRTVCKKCANSPQEDDSEENFQPCGNCDLPDACADFGCAVKSGLKEDENF